MELARGHDKKRPHPAVGMHSQDLKILAAIAVSFPARKAVLAIDIRLDRTTISRFDVCDPLPHRDNFDAKLVPRNTRITIERHFAEVAAEIRAADANPMHADQGFAGRSTFWFREFNRAEMLRFFQLNGFHVISVFRM